MNGEDMMKNGVEKRFGEIRKSVYIEGEKKSVVDREWREVGGRKVEDIEEKLIEWLNKGGDEVKEWVGEMYNEGLKWFVGGDYEGWWESLGGVSFDKFD